eukprot:GHVS01037688.1.p1 GENE.GHVS01037688.1~~GHVS01037688.1.p1  ORF type:complete len:797 (+),score=117.94 GHVS01037688.1:238-2628(+)
MKEFHDPRERLKGDCLATVAKPLADDPTAATMVEAQRDPMPISSSWCLCFPPLGLDRAEEMFGVEDVTCLNGASDRRMSLDGHEEQLLQTGSRKKVTFVSESSLKYDVPEKSSQQDIGGDRIDPSVGDVLLTEEDVRQSLLMSTEMLRRPLTPTLFTEEEPAERRATEEVLPEFGTTASEGTPLSSAMEVVTVVSSTSLIMSGSVEWEAVPISKVRLSDVEKVVKLHIKRLDDYYDSEKLFMANKYMEHVQGVLRYNTEYWEEFLGFLKDLNTDGVTSYHGAVGEEECRGILDVLEKYSNLISIRPETVSNANAEELTKYESLAIKVAMALKNLSFFYLDYLRVNCVSVPPGKVSDRCACPSAANLTTPMSWRNQPDTTSSGPQEFATNSSLALWAPVHMPVDVAEAALKIPGSNNALTSNSVLLMLLKGTQGNCFVHPSIESPRTEMEAPSTPLPAVDEHTVNSGEDVPRATKARGSWTAGAPLKNLSKRVSSGITRRGVPRKDKPTSGANRAAGSSIGKMGSKMLYSLTHHHGLLQHHGTQPKRSTEDTDSWTREKTKFLDLWYRVEKDTSVSIKVRGKLSCALFEVLAILNETDLAGNWAPMFKSASKEQQMSRASQLVRQVFDYPLLGQKESIMYCFGVDALAECGCVMIFCLPPPELSPFFLGYPMPLKGKMSRVQSATMCFLLFPISQGRQTTLEFYANFVHGIRFVPTKLITYVVKKVVKGMFVSICKQCQNFKESEYSERVKANPAFYDWMRDTITDFCGGGEGGDLSGCRLFGDAISLASFDINEFE